MLLLKNGTNMHCCALCLKKLDVNELNIFAIDGVTIRFVLYIEGPEIFMK